MKECNSNKSYSYQFLTGIILFLLTAGAAASPISVPIDNPVYEYLDRMESKGVLDNLIDGVKPFSRDRIAGLLLKVEKKKESLTRLDRKMLEGYLAEFRRELRPSQKYPRMESDGKFYSPFSGFGIFKSALKDWFKENPAAEQPHLAVWEEPATDFYAGLEQNVELCAYQDNQSWTGYQQKRYLRGSITENFGYALNVYLIMALGDTAVSTNYHGFDGYPPYTQAAYRVGDDLHSIDRSGGELAFHSRVADVSFAQQPLTIGAGTESGHLILADHVEPYPYFMIRKEWKRAVFTYVHGKVMADTLDLDEPDKYIVCHRLEFSPWRFMSLGLGECVVYGARNVDWIYLFPINFFSGAQNLAGDRDNKAVFADGEVRLPGNLKLYASLFIDDLHKKRLGTGYFGNKYAYQLGLSVADPLIFENLKLQAEYTAVMPWTYSHHRYINSYAHRSVPLAHAGGPNSETVSGHLKKWWLYSLQTGLKAAYTRHGKNPADKNVGGDIRYGHETLFPGQTAIDSTRTFLDDGEIEKTTVIEPYCRYELLNDFYIYFSVLHKRYSFAGSGQNETAVHAGVDFNY